MIIVTGGAGFIGSAIARELNKSGRTEIAIVDELGSSEKWKNLVNLKYSDFIHKKKFLETLPYLRNVELIIHMGACSSTTEKDADYLMDNNFRFSKELYDYCEANKVKLIYASSAAVYGDGKKGYSDENTDDYTPLNMYGYTKKLFDQYVQAQEKKGKRLKQCVGLRFFNVYGPNEYHKGSMASVAFHAFRQAKSDGKVRLFKSYLKGYRDGEQLRDFVHIKDAVDVAMFMVGNPGISGIFNVGTGKAKPFKSLVRPIFKALKKKEMIEFIEMPEALRGKYQYYTQADLSSLRKAGYKKKFIDVEEGVLDYAKNYLDKDFKHYD